MIAVSRPRTFPRQDSGADLLDAYATTRAELVGILTRMLGNSDDALDVAQTTFLKCWRTRAQLQDVRDLKAWIFRVGINAGRDFRRDVWRRRSRPLAAVPEPSAETSDILFKRESLERLRTALAGLRPKEREVFLLRQNSDHTYDEIASLCRIPVGTVKTRMRTAVIKLREVLRDTERK